MPRHSIFSLSDRDLSLGDLSQPLDLDTLVPPGGPWEVELGFGKGRYLLRSAQEHGERRFLGIELVSKYYRLLLTRARKRQLQNLVVVRGEALYLLSTVLPQGFASALHVYFPDPWHKNKHNKRRLFDRETIDLVLGALRPDYLEYGDLVTEILESHPDLKVDRVEEPWPDGARTNYEAKFITEGRPICRLRARLAESVEHPAFHPGGEQGIVAAG